MKFDEKATEPPLGPSHHMKTASIFIAKHLSVCCQEILNWDNSSLLCEGKVREAATLYRNVSSSSALSMVRSEVAQQAMAYVTKGKK